MEGRDKSMSKTIDEKVVEMKFDNRNFEKNVQVSLNTLDRLKEKSDMSKSAKGLDSLTKAANKVSFAGMNKSIDTVRIKLSGMQVVGATVLSNITKQAMGFAKKIERTISDSLVGGGIRRAQNIENAHFQLQGLLKDEQRVKAVMDDAMDSVDGTAYAYDEAAKAASQFAASGLEAGEDMQKALRGITGVAAMTNSQYEDISRIFTTVAGNGRLMGDQLLQLSGRGMNAAATLATYLGKTEQEVREMVSKGQIDFKTFADAMDDAFGEHAKKANDTFNGALSNVKAALSRIGAKFVSPLIEQNGKLVESFNILRLRVNDINKHVDPIANGFVAVVQRIASLIDRVTDNSLAFNFTLVGISNVMKSVGKVAKALGDAFLEMVNFKSQSQVIKMAENFAKLSKNMVMTDQKADKFKRTFKGVFALFDIFNYTLTSIVKFGLRTLADLLGITNGSLLDEAANLGDVIVKFRDWIKEGDVVTVTLTNMVNGIKKFISYIKNFNKSISGGGGGGPVTKTASAFNKILSIMSKAFGAIRTYFAGGMEQIKAFIERMRDMEGLTIGEVFKDFAENVLGYFFNIQAGFDMLENTVSRFSTVSSGKLGQAENAFKVFGEKIFGFIIKFKNKYAQNVDFGSVFAVAFSTGMVIALKKLQKTIEKIGNFVSTILSPLKSVDKVLKSFAGVLTAYQKKLKADVILEVAAAVAVLAGSIAVLALVPADRLIPATVAIGVLLAELAAITGILSASKLQVSMGTLAQVGIAFGGLAVGLLILAKTLKTVGEIDNFGDKIAKLVVIGLEASALISVLGIFSKLFMKDAPQLASLGVAILGFAAGMKLLVSALKDISGLDFSNMNESTWKIIGAAFVGFGVIVAASKGLSLKAGVGVAAMALAFKMIINALGDIGKLDTDSILNNIEALKSVLIAVGIAMGVMVAIGSIAGNNVQKAGVGILAMSAGMFLVVQTFKKLSTFRPKELAKSILSLVGIFTAFTIVIKASSAAGKEAHKAGLMLLEISAAMFLLTGSVAILGSIKPEKLWQGVAAVGALEILFGVMIRLSNVGKIDKSATGNIVALTVAVGVIMGCLAALTMVDSDKLWAATGALAAIMAMFGILEGVTIAVSKFSGNMPMAIGALVGITVVIGVLAAIIYALSKLPVDNVLGVSESLSKLLLSLVAVEVVLGLFGGPTLAKGVTFGVATLMAMITSLTIFFGAFGLIVDTIDEFTNNKATQSIEKGIEVAKTVGNGIGEFVGSIVAGFVTASTDSLPVFGQNLSDFMTNAQPFFDGLSNLKPETASAAKDLAVAIGALMAEDFLGKLAGITGEKTFDVRGIESIARALVTFANETKDIDEKTAKRIETTASAARALTDVARSIPNEGGKLAELIGDNTMGSFAEGMVAFGEGLKQYADSVDGLKTEAIENSVGPAEALTKVADMIPNSEGAIAWITGDNRMDVFGEQMVLFGQSLVTYSLMVTNVKVDTIERSRVAAEKVLSIAEMIPEQSGVVQFFTGGSRMDKFGEQLAKFGMALVEYGDSVSGLDSGSVEASIGSARAVLEIANAIPEKKDFKHLGKFGNKIVAFAKDIKDFDKQLKKTSPKRIIAASDAIGKLSNVFSNMADIDSGAAKNFSKALKKISVSSLTDFIKDFSKSAKKFSKCGEDLLDNVIKGVNTKKGELKSEFIVAVTDAAMAIRTTYSSFYSAGSYVADGFAKGILDNKYKATNAARKMGSDADNALRTELDEHSPSKKSFAAGEFYIDGFASALSKGTFRVAAAAKSVGQAANNAFENTIRRFIFNSNGVFEKAYKQISGSMGYGKNALKTFSDTYLTGDLKNAKVAVGAVNAVSKAITDYGKVLYQRSAYAEQDAKNQQEHNKALKDLEKQQKKINKDIKKYSKQNTKESKKQVKSLKEDLKKTKESITAAKKQIIQDQNDVVEHTKQAYLDLRNSLKNSVEAFINPLSANLDTGIDLFSRYDDSDTLLAQDQENLKTYTAEYEELVKKRDELQNEILKMEQINTTESRDKGKELEKELDKIEKSIEKAKDKIEDVEQSMEEHSAITTQSILDNMKSQVDGVTKYQNNLDTLRSKGVSAGLIEQLKEMGIQGADYVNQFTKMTDAEIQEANRLFEQSSKLSASALLSNFQDSMNKATAWADGMLILQNKGFNRQILEGLGDLGINGADYLNAFLAMDSSQISEFNEKYAKYLSIPDEAADKVLLSYAIAGNESIAKYLEALNTINNPGSASYQQLENVVNLTTENVWQSFAGSASSMVGKFTNKLTSKLKDTSSKASKSGKKVGTATIKGVQSGTNGDNGLSEKGIEKVFKQVSGAASTEMTKLKKTLKKGGIEGGTAYIEGLMSKAGFDIHSPSRAIIRVMGMVEKAFEVGNDKIINDVVPEAANAATSIVNAMSDVLDTDMDIQPTVTPVMDLSEIQNGTNSIYGMINDASGTVHLDNTMANSMHSIRNDSDVIWGAINELKDTVKQLGDNQGETVINNEFNIENPDPNAVANEVSNILSRQIDRRNREWA